MTRIPKMLDVKNDEMVDLLYNELRQLIFDNRFTVHPRELKEIAAQEISNLSDFIVNANEEQAKLRGRELAEKGFGEMSLLGMASKFRQYFIEGMQGSSNGDLKQAIQLTDKYMNNVMMGFNDQREQYILREQELLRRAFTKAHG